MELLCIVCGTGIKSNPEDGNILKFFCQDCARWRCGRCGIVLIHTRAEAEGEWQKRVRFNFSLTHTGSGRSSEDPEERIRKFNGQRELPEHLGFCLKCSTPDHDDYAFA